jgi:hypothetical protein
MTDRPSPPPNDQNDAPEIQELHKKVDALLDTPVARESDAWPLPLETPVTDAGQGYEPQRHAPE